MEKSHANILNLLKHLLLTLLILFSASADVLCHHLNLEAKAQQEQGCEQPVQDTQEEGDFFYVKAEGKVMLSPSVQLDFIKISYEADEIAFESMALEGMPKMLVHPTLLDYYQRLFCYYIAANAP